MARPLSILTSSFEPVILTGPRQSAGYFEQVRRFIGNAVGPDALERLQFIIDDPAAVARSLVQEVGRVRTRRRASNDSYSFNWLLQVPEDFQHPFEVTHESMRGLALHRDQPQHLLIANLRRAFSGIVAGNVKEKGVSAIEQHGPFELTGDPQVMELLDQLLRDFVVAGRMKLPGTTYTPCYRIVA